MICHVAGYHVSVRCIGLYARNEQIYRRVSRYYSKVDVLIADGFKVTRDDLIRLLVTARREIRRRSEISLLDIKLPNIM